MAADLAMRAPAGRPEGTVVATDPDTTWTGNPHRFRRASTHSTVQSVRASGWARTEMRERDAGYTTQYNIRYELWQLDSKTGEVLRRPGERQARRRH
jgi:hypothetical protein